MPHVLLVLLLLLLLLLLLMLLLLLLLLLLLYSSKELYVFLHLGKHFVLVHFRGLLVGPMRVEGLRDARPGLCSPPDGGQSGFSGGAAETARER